MRNPSIHRNRRGEKFKILFHSLLSGIVILPTGALRERLARASGLVIFFPLGSFSDRLLGQPTRPVTGDVHPHGPLPARLARRVPHTPGPARAPRGAAQSP